MMNAIELAWKGQKYVIPANRVLKAIAMIEEVITIGELAAYHARGAAPLAKLSMAFGAVLRYAGADVTDEQVYEGMLTATDADFVANSVTALLHMMMPPKSVQEAGKAASAGKSVGPSVSSRKRTKRQLAAAGSVQANSGN